MPHSENLFDTSALFHAPIYIYVCVCHYICMHVYVLIYVCVCMYVYVCVDFGLICVILSNQHYLIVCTLSKLDFPTIR